MASSASPSPIPPTSVDGWEILALVCELSMVASLAVVGWQAVSALTLQVLLALTLPVILAAVWAVWVAANSARRLALQARVILQIALVAASGAGLAAAGHTRTGVLLAGVGTVDFLVLGWRELADEPVLPGSID